VVRIGSGLFTPPVGISIDYLRFLKVFGGRYPMSSHVQRVPEAPEKVESN
jgi:hypothetical protein